MKALILGGNGLLGHKLFEVFSREVPTFATIRGESHSPYVLPNIDIREMSKVMAAIDRVKPDVVINAVGAVKQKLLATHELYYINAVMPRHLADVCLNRRVRLIHVSTDCVFSGKTGNYSEHNTPDPDDKYGLTKWRGEVSREGCVTVRSSFVGWQLKGREGLLSWLSDQRGRSIRGFKNAVFSGMASEVFADAIFKLATEHETLSGIYHVAAEPISKYDLLVKLRDALKWDIDIVEDGEFVSDRSLDGSLFKGITGFTAPSWDNMVYSLMREWLMYQPFYGGL